MRAWRLHDWIVSERLKKLVGRIDIVHAFPLASLRTLRTARALGIPTVLERCNAHTQFAYEIVQQECQRLGVEMPAGHEHAYNPDRLQREQAEYDAADFLLCPSPFVASTFLRKGFAPERIARFQYGYDPQVCFPSESRAKMTRGLTVLFAGGCAPRKGLHYALEAWLQSSAHTKGTFLIAGEFIPGYAEKLSSLLDHPSVKRIGFRKDLAEVMRGSDVLVLPSIEEGSALVTYDARACGCVLAVSDASGAVCQHMENALVHAAGDVATLAEHFSMLDTNQGLLENLRASSLTTAHELTWQAAGLNLIGEYRRLLLTKTRRPWAQKGSASGTEQRVSG